MLILKMLYSLALQKYFTLHLCKAKCTQPITKTLCMQKPPYQHFRLGIFSFYRRHVAAAGFLIVHVCHVAKVST